MVPADLAAERALWGEGENARRAAQVHLTRPPSGRNPIWEADHKQLPILALPPNRGAVCPWMTTIVDEGTRALVGWSIALSPHAGTVLTAILAGLVHDPERGPFDAVPALVRIDRGLEFAVRSVTEALAALGVDVHRLPAYTPHRKGKVERFHRSIEQMLLSGLPGFTGGPWATSPPPATSPTTSRSTPHGSNPSGHCPHPTPPGSTGAPWPWTCWSRPQPPQAAEGGSGEHPPGRRTPGAAGPDPAHHRGPDRHPPRLVRPAGRRGGGHRPPARRRPHRPRRRSGPHHCPAPTLARTVLAALANAPAVPVTADQIAHVLEAGEPEELTRSNQGSGWTKDTAGY
ncbi:hypothetical protein ACFW4K_02105 [Nocardiopsis alba]|uniref:hypothetical protein n=1 Tax=Nocardiopsis alba TaxID=53437 RepID=UPI00366D6CDA